MGKFLTIRIDGMKEMQAKFAGLKDVLIEGINDEMLLAAIDIQDKAVQNIHSNGTNDQGMLAGGMTLVENRGERKVVVGNIAFYSPYIEFGTGQKVNVPAEWKAYATTFQGKAGHGNFDQFVDNLIDWLKRKGITPSTGTDVDDYDYFAFHIALKILREGQEPHPFLYPAYQQVKKELIERIKKIIKDAVK